MLTASVLQHRRSNCAVLYTHALWQSSLPVLLRKPSILKPLYVGCFCCMWAKRERVYRACTSLSSNSLPVQRSELLLQNPRHTCSSCAHVSFACRIIVKGKKIKEVSTSVLLQMPWLHRKCRFNRVPLFSRSISSRSTRVVCVHIGLFRGRRHDTSSILLAEPSLTTFSLLLLVYHHMIRLRKS